MLEPFDATPNPETESEINAYAELLGVPISWDDAGHDGMRDWMMIHRKGEHWIDVDTHEWDHEGGRRPRFKSREDFYAACREAIYKHACDVAGKGVGCGKN